MAQREQILLDWLARHAPEEDKHICEVFARPDHARFAVTLANRCLTCHVGETPTAGFEAARCAECHAQPHADWSGSAHANSLTHLRLPTVDPITREPGLFDFGPHAGLSCVACHQPAGDHDVCAGVFATRSCAVCHSETDVQWREWLAGPQPRRVSWPPGSIDFDFTGDTRGCVDCHMPAGEHRWAARRNLDLLRAGIALSIRSTADRGAEVVLTNLSGHDYPTGSTRRALDVYVRVDGGDEFLLASLSPPAVNADASPTDAALRPGEQRVFKLPGHPQRVTCRLVYVRNRFIADGYTVEIASETRSFDPG